MTIHPQRAVLWDMDGTLLDSAEYHWLAWRDALAAEHISIQYEQFAATFGQRNDTILRSYFGDDITIADINRISDTKEALYRQLVQTRGVTLLPGVEQWLHRLAETGWRQAIASAAPRQNIHVILDTLGISDMFGTIVGAEDVSRGKPDPAVFLTAAERLGVLPAACIVVEDAPHGIEAAHRAGMRTIGVRSTHPNLSAHLVVDRLDQLPPDAFEQLLAHPTR